jgi:hypothetical protein
LFPPHTVVGYDIGAEPRLVPHDIVAKAESRIFG